jgi:uncharacterized protein DUF3108
MRFSDKIKASLRALTVLCLGFQISGVAEQNAAVMTTPFPSPETLSYRIEWRMVLAGQAKLQMDRLQQNWRIKLSLQSGGLVSRLFRVDDSYSVTGNDKFCGESSSFESQEGKRHVTESEQFDNNRHKAIFDVHDLTKNVQEHHEVDIAPCTYEIIGALASVRLGKLEPGKSITIPIVNGKKMAYAKIEAQAKENISIDGNKYPTTRYEAYVFDNVVFRRKGSLRVWLSDDAAHVPVQLQFQMGFPIGNITLELEKAEKT